MYDRETNSLWNTLQGQPVLGPLVGKGIQLERKPVVTTTWGAWKKKHPKTTVLSLKTGHRRNYDEGAAYHDYFATDAVMFTVPSFDPRIKQNKAQVLSFMIAPPLQKPEPVAVSVEYLTQNPIAHHDINGVSVVILTDESGANRAYAAGDLKFTAYDRANTATDEAGNKWTLHEDALRRDGADARDRLPANRAFWFGWSNAFPGAALIQ